MNDFKNGLRLSAEPRKPNTPMMAGYAAAMTDDEIRAAADYFGSMRWTPWIRVVETDTVPKTRILGGMHLTLEGEGAGTEPLGARIVESPVNAEHTELLRDPRSGFVAYVPPGSVARGEALARNGRDGVAACTICHGEDLDGLSIVPGLRGRSPSYIARQLADMKLGQRRGAWTPLMAPVVATLTAEDILNLAAYLTSLEPLP
jgi:cytochrome c553